MVVIFLPTASLTGKRAGARRHAVDVNGAGAALRDAAAVFGAGQADVFPDRPEQRRVGFDVDVDDFSIDVEAHHNRPPLSALRPLLYAPLKPREP